MNLNPRLTWEEYAMALAHTAASRSEDPWRQVGACALDKDNKILGLGYNGLASGKNIKNKKFWENRDLRRKFMIHAEANCLSLFQSGKCKLLAVTLLPCQYCATLIAAYKIPKVVYDEVYERDTEALQIFSFYDIECLKLEKKEKFHEQSISSMVGDILKGDK